MNKISLILLLLLPVWNCSEDDEAVIDNAANDENAQRTFAEAQARYVALGENFRHVPHQGSRVPYKWCRGL